MKVYFYACVLMLSLSIVVGCNKSDEPAGKDSNVKGNFLVENVKGEVKYGYVYYEDDGSAEYSFYDRNVLKYIDQELEDIDVEFTSIFFYHDAYYNKIDYVGLTYKVNYYKETGKIYESQEEDTYKFVDFSASKDKIKCSSISIPVTGYNLSNNRELGTFDASFSVEGKPKDITDIVDDYDTRGITIIEITDNKEIAFLKAMRMKAKAIVNN